MYAKQKPLFDGWVFSCTELFVVTMFNRPGVAGAVL